MQFIVREEVNACYNLQKSGPYIGKAWTYPADLNKWARLFMRKCLLHHMQTTKVQISLRIHRVVSAPLLFAA